MSGTSKAANKVYQSITGMSECLGGEKMVERTQIFGLGFEPFIMMGVRAQAPRDRPGKLTSA